MLPIVSTSHGFVEWAVPEEMCHDDEVFRRAKRMALLDVTFLFWSVLYAEIYVALGSARCGALTLVVAASAGASLLVLRSGKPVTWSANVMCLGGSITLAALACWTGGSAGPSLLWLCCAPVTAVMTCGVAWGGLWLAVNVTAITAFLVAEALG